MLYRDYLKSKYQNTAVKLANVEGVPCVLEYSKGKNMRNYEVYGNSVQDGTPSPERPVEIQSVGDLTKNLLPYPYYNTTRTVNGVTWTDNGDGTITASGTATDYTSFSIVYKKQGVIQPNKEYVFSHNGTDTKNIAVDIMLYDKDGNFIRSITSNSYFTTAENEELITINLKRSVSGYSVGGTFKPQLELGSTATEYEPYHKYDIPITVTGTRSETTHIYLDEPLRKVGDYADYIDFKNQKVVRNILKQSLSAAMVYKRLDSVVRILCRNTSMSQKYDTHMLSTIFNYNYAWLANTECIFHYNATHYNYYWSIYWSRLGLTYDGTNVYRTDDIEQTSLTDSEIVSIANEWLSTLSDKDKEIYMILDMPTEENISLPALKTFKGTSIISVDTSVQPSNIKAKYVRL